MTWTVDGDTVHCTWESATADGVEISIQGDTCTIEKGVYSWEDYQAWSNAAANELTELLEDEAEEVADYEQTISHSQLHHIGHADMPAAEDEKKDEE